MRGLVRLGVTVLIVGSLPALAGAASARTKHGHLVSCQHLRGHNIVVRGRVRVFRKAGDVYGCLRGLKKAYVLWTRSPETGNQISRITGHYLAISSTTNNQYEYDASLAVFDLRRGNEYTIASEQEPLGGPPQPPWPVDSYVLAANGRSAVLRDVYTASGSGFSKTGQELVVLGFHFHARTVATSAPGAIDPRSLRFNGHMVRWTQGGMAETASV